MSPVAVITGASAGIGRACVGAFASNGYDVALLARGQAGVEAAGKEAEAMGRRALTATVDMSVADHVEQAADRVEAELGPIDVWVNDAFTSVFAPFVEIAADEFERVTRVTYIGFVNGTRAALKRMLPRDRGVIVQVGSALAYRGIPLQSAYSGAKHAIQGFTESVRCELFHDHRGVRITSVQMPAVNTPQFSWLLSRLPRHPQPVPPIYQPEVAARAVLFAAEHPGRRQYWVGGTTAATLIANAVIPGLLDRYLGRTGYDSQQTDQPADPDRANNLWQPLDDHDDHGAQGVFGDRSHTRSVQWWYTSRRRAVLSALGVAAGAAAGTAGAFRTGARARSGGRDDQGARPHATGALR